MNKNTYKNVMTEIDQLIENHYNKQPGEEKKLRSKTLKYANCTLESKLKKLKSLYEKKCAQCEAMKAALSIERDLCDTTLIDLASESPSSEESFSNLESKMQHLSTAEEREQFCIDAIAKTLEALVNVKNYAVEGILTGEIMSHCLDILQQENPEVLFVDWIAVRDILKATDDTAIAQFTDQYRANEYNNWFFVLNESFHWSLMLYAKSKNTFFHYDSRPNRNHGMAQKVATALAEFTDSTELFEVRCSPQTVDHVSGFHVIENITKLLPILEEGRIVIGDVEVTLEKISLLKMLPLKCRVLVMKLYLQKKLQLLNEAFAK